MARPPTSRGATTWAARVLLYAAAASAGFHGARLLDVAAPTVTSGAPEIGQAPASTTSSASSAQVAAAQAPDQEAGLGALRFVLGARGLLPAMEAAAGAEGAGLPAIALRPLREPEARLAQWLVLRYEQQGLLDDAPAPLSADAADALRTLQATVVRRWLLPPKASP